MPKTHIEKTTAEIAAAIERLSALLVAEYGQDFAYVIVAHGWTIARSDASGVIQPVIK